MTREENKNFFADVRLGLSMNLGPFCDRNMIYRSEFSNFMKDQYNHIPDEKLDAMREDIINHIEDFMKIYRKVA